MREFLDGILTFISQTALTDLEFDTIETEAIEYDQATYDYLAGILAARENISDAQERLLSFYKAKGVSVTQLATASTQIFLGQTL